MAVDISNYTGYLTPEVCEAWKEAGVERVIIGTQDGRIARQQLQICAQYGFLLDLYIFLYWDEQNILRWTDAVVLASDFNINIYWLDCEAENTDGYSIIRRIDSVLNAAKQSEKPPEIGIYTGAWWWNANMSGVIKYQYLKLWYAEYDNMNNMEDWPRNTFGGWTWPYMKQYAADVELNGAKVDLNIYRK